MAAKGEFCKFTDKFYKRARAKTYESDKLMEKGFKITGYLRPFK
jgi:hypothetical protein